VPGQHAFDGLLSGGDFCDLKSAQYCYSYCLWRLPAPPKNPAGTEGHFGSLAPLRKKIEAEPEQPLLHSDCPRGRLVANLWWRLGFGTDWDKMRHAEGVAATILFWGQEVECASGFFFA